jgi:hypothetical protein
MSQPVALRPNSPGSGEFVGAESKYPPEFSGLWVPCLYFVLPSRLDTSGYADRSFGLEEKHLPHPSRSCLLP